MVSTPSTGTQEPEPAVHAELCPRTEDDQQQGLPPQSGGPRHSSPGTGGAEPQASNREAQRDSNFAGDIGSPSNGSMEETQDPGRFLTVPLGCGRTARTQASGLREQPR